LEKNHKTRKRGFIKALLAVKMKKREEKENGRKKLKKEEGSRRKNHHYGGHYNNQKKRILSITLPKRIRQYFNTLE
jgi:hypothetical protein